MPVTIAGAAGIGPLGAQAVMIEFSDFQCPFCGRFAGETLPVLKKSYVDAGKLRIVFRHLPLAMHANAAKAAQSANCAARDNRF